MSPIDETNNVYFLAVQPPTSITTKGGGDYGMQPQSAQSLHSCRLVPGSGDEGLVIKKALEVATYYYLQSCQFPSIAFTTVADVLFYSTCIIAHINLPFLTNSNTPITLTILIILQFHNQILSSNFSKYLYYFHHCQKIYGSKLTTIIDDYTIITTT